MKIVLTLSLLLLAPFGVPRAEVPVMPFDEVRSGMKGTGRTVFSGTEIESFDVEILGKLPNVGPDQNLILARCSGGPLAQTGVLAGMSGSPVTIDGKLVGAVAYSWGFTKDAIAGITPIEEMLAIPARDAESPARISARSLVDEDLEALRSPAGLAEFFAGQLHRLVQRSPAPLRASIPLSISGMSPEAILGALPGLPDAGFVPLQAGGGSTDPSPSPPLEPGSALGLKLVRGDIEIAASGTVTWVEGDGVLAFGHPLFGLGSIDLPLTGASVQALIPSLRQSAKIATPLSEIGALRQDRATGVFGRTGVRPRMIPVRMQLNSSTSGARTFSFDVADDPLLSPLLLYASLNGILSSRERTFGSASLRLREGSVIKMLDEDDVRLDNLFSGSSAFNYGTGISAYVLYLLMNNTWSTPRIAGVNLIFEYDERPQTATILRASLDRYRVHPGDTVVASVVARPYRGPDQVFAREIVIPPHTPPGRLSLFVSGAAAASQAETREERLLPQDLNQLIRLINQLRRNDQIFILASGEDAGVLLGGARLPSLPPSVNSVLSRPRSRGNFSIVNRRLVLEEVIDTDFLMEGAKRLVLEVEER